MILVYTKLKPILSTIKAYANATLMIIIVVGIRKDL